MDSDFSSIRNENKDVFSKIHLPSLTEEEALDMTKPIKQDVLKTMKSLKNNKSPGTDRLPGEPILVKVFNYALSGDPPQTWSEAIISVT